MPKRPKRPRDPMQLAKLIGDIATGRVKDPGFSLEPSLSMGRAGGLVGGKARAKSLTPSKRRLIARKAALARWKKKKI